MKTRPNEIKKHLEQNQSKDGDYYDWEKITEFHIYDFLPIIDISTLLFMLEDGKDELESIFLVDAENKSLLDFINRRNKCYFDYLDKTENRNLLIKKEVKNILGERNFSYLEQYTNWIIDINKKLIEDCEKSIQKIQEFSFKI